MNILVVIPARGGSKGLPGKNIKPLLGKPLIYWSIDAARSIVSDEDICVSTDCQEITDVVEHYGLRVPFIRPQYLATDSAGTVDVLLHALEFYQKEGKVYDVVLLLQPTSPLRTEQHIRAALSLFSKELDMVVSVKPSHAASVLVKENEQGFLESVFNKNNLGRQFFNFWEYNGSIYVINAKSLQEQKKLSFEKIVKYPMSEVDSIDIDTQLDFDTTELILTSNISSSGNKNLIDSLVNCGSEQKNRSNA